MVCATQGLIDAPKTLELKDKNGNVIWNQTAYGFLEDYEKAPDTAKNDGTIMLEMTAPMMFDYMAILLSKNLNQPPLSGVVPFNIIEP